MMSDLQRLKTKRVVLASGLFDAGFYRAAYADIRVSPVDPLTHYLMQGEAEGRSPNPVFLPAYYRRYAMALAPAEQNALAHYAEEGERLGYRPHPAFDPRTYLAANPALAAFVDRPLFHFLKIGRDAGLPVAPGPRGAALARVLQAQRHATDVAASGGRDHDALMRYKQSLVRELGVEEGFALCRKTLDLSSGSRLDPRPVAGLHEFAASRAGAFHEIAPGGELLGISTPRVIDDGGASRLSGTTRSSFVACLIDARVRPRSGIIEVGDAVLLDYQGEERALIDDALDFDPAVFHAADATVWLIGPESEASSIELDEGFTLLGSHSDDFANWMLDLLPRYLAASASGALPPVPVLIDQGLPEPQRQCLQLMLPAGVGIIPLASFATARVRRLWCAPSPMCTRLSAAQNGRVRWASGAPSPRFVDLVREMARRAEPIAMVPTGQARIYLAPKPVAARKPVGSAVIEAAAARGFAIVDPADLDFPERVRLIRHARFVIAEQSSVLPLALFAQPGTRLCCLFDTDASELAPQIAILQQIGIEVTVLTGPDAQIGERYSGTSGDRIDPAAFRCLLDDWSDRLPPLRPENRPRISIPD
jgi:capsular polysaccharide biosynthesis protein